MYDGSLTDFGCTVHYLCKRLYLYEIEHQLVLMNSSTMDKIHIQEESHDDQHQHDMLIFLIELHFKFHLAELSILKKHLKIDIGQIHVSL